MGCEYIDPTTKQLTFSRHFPANTSSAVGVPKAMVVDDPSASFMVQADASVTAGDINGMNFAVTLGSGSTVTGISGAELDVTTGATTAGLPIKAIDISQDPENSDVGSDATNVQVVIQNSIFGQKGAGLA